MAAARAHGATESLPPLLSAVSLPYVKLGLVDRALGVCQEAFEIAEELGQTRDAAHSALVLADALVDSGRFDEAEPWYHRGIERYRAADVPHELGRALNNMAWAYHEAGHYQQALTLAAESLDLARAFADRNAEASVLDTLGMAYRGLDRLPEALDALRGAVQAYADTGNRFLGADTLDHYADTLAAAHRPDEARAAWAQAADWFKGIDDARAAAIHAKAQHEVQSTAQSTAQHARALL